MKVLIVEPNKTPFLKDIEPGLASLQREVKGCIEAVYPFEDEVCIICNEDGKLLKMDLNRALRDNDGDVYDIIAGTFIVAGLGKDDFTDLTQDQQQKYYSLFETPESFVFCNNRWQVFPTCDDNGNNRSINEHCFDDYELEI